MNWITPKKRRAIYALDGALCTYCGGVTECNRNKDGSCRTLDHVVLRRKGGYVACGGNLVTACKTCNDKRNRLSLADWFRLLASEGHNLDFVAQTMRLRLDTVGTPPQLQQAA